MTVSLNRKASQNAASSQPRPVVIATAKNEAGSNPEIKTSGCFVYWIASFLAMTKGLDCFASGYATMTKRSRLVCFATSRNPAPSSLRAQRSNPEIKTSGCFVYWVASGCALAMTTRRGCHCDSEASAIERPNGHFKKSKFCFDNMVGGWEVAVGSCRGRACPALRVKS